MSQGHNVTVTENVTRWCNAGASCGTDRRSRTLLRNVLSLLRPRYARPRDASKVICAAACYSIHLMRRTWSWTFDLPPEELWPVLADTNRFNEAMGLPPYALEETPQPNGTVLRRGKGKAAGFTLEWEEK